MRIEHYIILIVLFFPILGHSNGLTVAIIDTGVNAPTRLAANYTQHDFTGTGSKDKNGHGTNIAGLIHKYAGTDAYRVYDLKGIGHTYHRDSYIKALQRAHRLRPDILNISAGGLDISVTERRLIKLLLDGGTVIVAASGNDGIDFNKKGCIFYPACYDERIVVVANTAKSSNKGKGVDVTIDGNDKTGFGVTLSGSSQSAAIYTGTLINRILNK